MKLTLAVVVVLTYIGTTNAFFNPAALAMAGGGGGLKQALMMSAIMNPNGGGGGGGGSPALAQNPMMKMMLIKMVLAQLGENPFAAYSLMQKFQLDPMQLLMMSGGENAKILMPMIMQQQMRSQMMPPGAAQPGQMTPM